MTLELALTGAGWLLSGLAFGLWYGERGRRKDLQWIAEAAIGPRRARMEEEAPAFSNPELDAEAERVTEFQVDALADQLEAIASAEGVEVTRDEVEAEARRLVERSEGLGEIT